MSRALTALALLTLLAAVPASSQVQGHQKISDTEGGFTGVLDAVDWFGTAVAAPGDLDGDGVGDLTLEVAEAQAVLVEVYDGLGRRVATLHNGPMEPGAHVLTLDGSALPAGVYFLRLSGEGFTATRRLTLLR